MRFARSRSSRAETRDIGEELEKETREERKYTTSENTGRAGKKRSKSFSSIT